MRTNQVKAKLEAGESAFGLFTFLKDPHVVGCTASVGFDFVCVCMEHGQPSFETLQTMVYAADAAGIAPFARVSELGRTNILRALETGVQGILLPWCESAAQAADLVRWSRYAPEGQRGAYGNAYPADYLRTPFAEYMAIANREVMVMAQIESPAGVAAVAEIAATDGLDVVMVGPGDLSVGLGHPLEWSHPELVAAIDRVVDATLAAGKQPGLMYTEPELLERYLARGVKLWWYGQDLNALRLKLLDDARWLREAHGWRPNPGRQPGRPTAES